MAESIDHKKDIRRTIILTVSIIIVLVALKYVEARYGMFTRILS